MLHYPHPSRAEIESCVLLTHQVIADRLGELGFAAGQATNTKASQSDPLRKEKKRPTAAESTPHGRPKVADMTAQPRHLSKAERDEWHIPRCVSNYINPKGELISLEARNRSTHTVSINPGLKHSKMSDYVSKLSSETKAKIAASEKAEQERLELENAIEEERLQTLVEANQEARRRELREIEQHESVQERAERKLREKQLREHRQHIHRQELRRDRIKDRLGISDERLERDVSDAMALGPDQAAVEENAEDVFFDERLTNITAHEVHDVPSSKHPYNQKNSEFAFDRRGIAGEVERMLAGTDADGSELVFENDDGEEDPFAALDKHLEAH